MSHNLIQAIQKNLGYADLKKIDPNTQEPVNDGKEEDRLNQAAIPAVLIVLYKYTRTDEGAHQVLNGNFTNDWLEMMLGEDTADAIDKVAAYSGVPAVIVAEKMELVAKQAIGLVRELKPASEKAVKDMVAAERTQILTHLPPALHMGELLNDTTIDDGVRKMEGPVSSFMSALGNMFSGSERGKDE